MLRGINVSGQKRVRMDRLKALYESLKLRDVETYVQSGNVIFKSQSTKTDTLERKIEGKILEVFGFEVRVFLRARDEFRKIIENNPFKREDAGKLHVTFLSGVPSSHPREEIERAKAGAEKYSLSGKEVYLLCPNGYGRTRLSNNFFEKKLGVQATTRNWNTINRLYEMANQ
jgi:uncharacterized protein (DUF1697 family)